MKRIFLKFRHKKPDRLTTYHQSGSDEFFDATSSHLLDCLEVLDPDICTLNESKEKEYYPSPCQIHQVKMLTIFLSI